jgi:hypothetical protein
VNAGRATTIAWSALLLVAAVLAVRALAMWLVALVSGAPVLYGEGAVAHAGAILARGGDPYAIEPAGTFVAANYPPLAFVVAALGEALGPFAALRAASIAATVAFALVLAWRARSKLRGAAIGLSWLALFPVEIWGPAAKPDPLAVSLTGFAVLIAGPSWRRAGTAGALGALAILAKPTAALPLVATAVWLLFTERRTGARVIAATAATVFAGAALVVLRSGLAGPFEHVVARNALSFSLDAVIQLALVAVLCLGAFVVLAATHADARVRAYLVGAAAVVVLGAREGATINYLLDLGAASAIALAGRAPMLRSPIPVVLAAQLAIGAVVFQPFATNASTGAWRDPARAAALADLPRLGPYLAEDSGLLLANRLDPDVDDLFLWARLVARGAMRDEVTSRVREGSFPFILSDVDLAALDRAPAFERQRWIEPLVSAVLARYELERTDRGVYRYVRPGVR